MKKITSILLAIMLILGVCGSAMLTIGAEEATSDTWDGTASIKWYLDGTNADGEYELKTAEDLAGLAYLVGAARAEGRYTGVYHRADGTVAGYVAGSNDVDFQDSTLIPTSDEGLTSVNGDTFLGKTILLTVDVVLNEGNAADWATTAPAYMWQPIGGNARTGSSADPAGFDGIFDGQGHTVSGMYYKAAEGVLHGGLFGRTGQQFPGTIKNLKLTNFYVCGSTAGALVGRSNKGLTVENVCVSNGIVENVGTGAGALIGTVFGGAVVMRYCSVEDVKVQGGMYMGLFTGMVVGQDLEIYDSYVKNSSAKGITEAGLVAGRISGGNLTLRNIYATAEIEAVGNEEETAPAAGLIYAVAGSGNNPTAKQIEGVFHISTITGTVVNEALVDMTTAVELAQITGEAAKTALTGFDFETVWKTVEGGTPVIELRGAVNDDDSNEDDGDVLLPDDNGGSSSNNTSNKNDKNDKTETTETKDNSTTTDAVAEENKGCGSVVGAAGLALVVVLSGAAVMLKKEN